MPATFGRLKTWVRERLRYSDLNAEFNNLLTNLDPTGVGSGVDNTAKMQADSDPAPSGVEAVPVSLETRIQQILYVLRQLGGGTYWYSLSGATLAAVDSQLFGYLPSAGLTTTEALIDYLQRGGLLNAASFSSADVAVGDFDGTNKKFGNYAMKVKGSTVFAAPGSAAQSLSLAMHFRNLAAGDYLAYNPLLGIELYLDGAGLLTARVREQGAATETTKTFTTVAGAVSRAGSTTWQHATLRTRMSAVAGANTDLLHLLRDGAAEGTQQNGVSIPVGSGDGGFWFFGARPSAPTWDHFSAMLVTPDAEAVSPWTLTATGTGAGAVSGGVLTMTADDVSTVKYTRTTGVNLAQMTIETKFRITSQSDLRQQFLLICEDDSMNRALYAYAFNGKLRIYTSSTTELQIPCDVTKWNSLRITTLGATDPVLNVWLNGVKVIDSFTMDEAVAIATDQLAFGNLSAAPLGETVTTDFEYFAYTSTDATVYAPVAAAPATTGQLDDIVMAGEQLSADIISRLLLYPASQVYKADFKRGLQLPAYPLAGVLAAAPETRYRDFKVALVSDGLTPLSLQIAGSFQSSAVPVPTFRFGLNLQRGSTGVSRIEATNYYIPPAGDVPYPVSLAINQILPLGVHVYRGILTDGNSGLMIGDWKPVVTKGNGGR